MTDIKIGVMGLGKLGLPLALLLNAAKFQVTGYDPSSHPYDVVSGAVPPPDEPGIKLLLSHHTLDMVDDPVSLVRASEVIFVVVPTPHPSEYDGGQQLMMDYDGSPLVPLSDGPGQVSADFEYGYLVQAVRDVSRAAWTMNKSVTLVIVSTVLPGTIDREIRPILAPEVTMVYSPSLISLGSVLDDLQNPEFVIIGADRHEDTTELCEIHSRLHSQPFQIMDIPSAELTKIAYNAYTSMKIVFANTIMEIAEKTGGDCDRVVDALALATKNLMSGRYLRGGMVGGGYCHPRDVVAGSWLAQRLGMRADLFGFLSNARQQQSGWLADVTAKWVNLTKLPVVLCGEAYKPGTSLTGGSPATLLAGQLGSRNIFAPVIDPYSQGFAPEELAHKLDIPAVYVITTNHAVWTSATFPSGSVVIDPHGKIPDRPGVTLVRLGRRQP